MAASFPANVCLTLGSIFMTLISMTSASVMQYSIGDVYVELQTWGTIVIGRFNGSDVFHHDLEYSRLKIKPLEISLLDAGHNSLVSHKFDSNRYQGFKITSWEGVKYNNLGASGRRLSSVSLGDLSGHLHFSSYIFTEGGELTAISEDYHQKVEATDILVELTFENLTHCNVCREATFVDLRLQVSGGVQVQTQVTMKVLEDVQLDLIHIPASAFITVSNKAKIDGDHVIEVPGFPEVEDESEGTDVIIRLPTFSTSATFGLFVKQDRRSPQQVKDDIKRKNNSKQTRSKQLNIVQNNDVSIQMRSATSGKQGTHEYSSFNFQLICIFCAVLLFKT